MTTARIVIPYAAARVAATKAGWPADACSTAWLESRIDAVFSRNGNDSISVEVEIKHLPMMAQLVHDIIASPPPAPRLDRRASMTCETETTALAAKIHAECDFCFERNDIHEALELLGQMVEYGSTTPEEIEAFLRMRRAQYDADLASD